MTAYSNTAEGGTNGVAISVANTGGASGQAIDEAPTLGGTSTAEFSNVQAFKGSLAYEFDSDGTNVARALWRNHVDTSQPNYAVRVYVYFDALPSAGTTFLMPRSAFESARCALAVSNTGVLSITNNTETIIWSSAASTISADTWYRFEIYVQSGTGDIELKTYLGDSLTEIAAASNTMTGQALGTGMGTLRLGMCSSGQTVAAPWYFDDLAVDDAATGLLGPSAAASTGDTVYNGAGNLCDVYNGAGNLCDVYVS